MRMMRARAVGTMAFTANGTIAPAGPIRSSVDRLTRSEFDMKVAIVTCAVMLATAFATDTLQAQGTVQSITTTRVDVVHLASG